MRQSYGSARLGLAAAAAVLAGAAAASAATSFSNSLTGFTGNSTLPATQTAVDAAGFSFYSIDGFDGIDKDPTVAFDASGAHFGTLIAGDNGRNYMRTKQEDFASTTFAAEITFVAPDLKNQDAFFGLGTGDTALFGWPDWSTQFSSVLILPQITDGDVSQLTTFRTFDDKTTDAFVDTPAPALGNGTHRIRLGFNASAKTATFSLDLNYAGGAFAADVTAPVVNVSSLYGSLVEGGVGWLDEPSRLYFGGDDGIVFKDFSVTVGTPPTGDFDNNTIVDGDDVVAWQQGLGITTGALRAEGDGDGNGAVNNLDLGYWENQFGAGYSTPVAAVIPEPTAALLGGVAAAVLGAVRRRR